MKKNSNGLASMGSYHVALSALIASLVVVSGSVATALTAASSASTTPAVPLNDQPVALSQALPGQGSIIGGILLGSSTSTVLPSLATTTAAATTTPGLGVPSEQNNLGITGSCVVTQSSNAKQCDIYVTCRDLLVAGLALLHL
jgi:hypothetical protein